MLLASWIEYIFYKIMPLFLKKLNESCSFTHFNNFDHILNLNCVTNSTNYEFSAKGNKAPGIMRLVQSSEYRVVV